MILVWGQLCAQTMSTYVATLSNGFGRRVRLSLQTEWTILSPLSGHFLKIFSLIWCHKYLGILQYSRGASDVQKANSVYLMFHGPCKQISPRSYPQSSVQFNVALCLHFALLACDIISLFWGDWFLFHNILPHTILQQNFILEWTFCKQHSLLGNNQNHSCCEEVGLGVGLGLGLGVGVQQYLVVKMLVCGVEWVVVESGYPEPSVACSG